MTIEQLRALHQARPFKPFTVHLADGREFHVPHAEFLSQSPTGRVITIFKSDDTAEYIDLLLVSSLSVNPAINTDHGNN
jgi:hypothetical protein